MNAPPPAISAPLRPTLEDVARLAGVSRATASRVVNGDPVVAAATAQQVQRAVSQLGYRPNRAARALVTRQVGAVALVVPETDERVFSDPFFPRAYHGVLTAFADTDRQVILAMDNPGDAPSRMINYLAGGHVDGAVVVSHHGPALARALLQARLPTVFVGDPELAGAPYVDVDQVSAARTAVEHLIERGARRIGTVTGPLDMGAGWRRLAGFREALAAAGLPADAVEEGDFTTSGGQRATARLLEAHPQIDGLFVASDLMAAGALRTLAAAGRSVPGDVRLVSIDNSPVALELNPRLSTMDNPPSEIARLAGEMLRAMLDGQPVTSPVILPSRLHVRESS